MNEKKAIDLFLEAESHNWDDGYNKLVNILNDPDCDLGTISLIYWRAQPEYYLKYDKAQFEASATEEYNFISFVQRKLLSADCPCIIEFDPSSEQAGKSKPENTKRKLPPQVYEITKGKIKATDLLTGKVGPGVLSKAAEANDLDKLKKLLSETDDPSITSSLLTFATKGKAIDVMKYLIENGADLDKKFIDNERVLHRACSIETVSLLLDSGAKLQLKSWHGTPLHYASGDKWNSYEEGVLELLLARGAKPNFKNAKGETSLHTAAAGGRTNNLKLLIEAGGKLDSVDKTGRTLMHSAVEFPGWNHINRINRGPMVAELLKLGVSADIEDQSGQSARGLAEANARRNHLGELEKSQIIDLLEITIPDESETRRLSDLERDAREHKNNNEHLAAIKIWRALLMESEKAHSFEHYQFLIAQAYAQIPDSAKALEALAESLKGYDEFEYVYYRKLDILKMLGDHDEADELLIKMLAKSDSDIRANELAGTDNPKKSIGPTKGYSLHKDKANLLCRYAKDFKQAADTLQEAFDKKIYNQRGKTSLLKAIGSLRNGKLPDYI